MPLPSLSSHCALSCHESVWPPALQPWIGGRGMLCVVLARACRRVFAPRQPNGVLASSYPVPVRVTVTAHLYRYTGTGQQLPYKQCCESSLIDRDRGREKLCNERTSYLATGGDGQVVISVLFFCSKHRCTTCRGKPYNKRSIAKHFERQAITTKMNT